MKIDLSELHNRKEFINEQKHPSLPLLIFNYNHRCQWKKEWNEFTRMSRGLITDLEGNIVSRSFPKFFNLDEAEETKVDKLMALGRPQVFEKLDGSLGVQYYDGDIPQIATRGSFTSDQAIWASEWIQSRYTKEDFLDGYTYLYEIIYPENRIVLDYGEREELVLLAVIDTETGGEVNPVLEAKKLGINCAEPFEGTWEEVKAKVAAMDNTEEGFVLVYPGPLRVKIKGEEYKRIHKLLSSLSSRSIWEALKIHGELDDAVPWSSLPEEVLNWVASVKWDILNKFEKHNNLAIKVHQKMLAQSFATRKEQALWLLENYKEHAPFVFAMLDNRDWQGMVWKHVEPPYATPFKEADQEEMEVFNTQPGLDGLRYSLSYAPSYSTFTGLGSVEGI